jgi:hypothetical protein
MQSLWLLLFSITAGFTASGIIANLYRLCGFNTKSRIGRVWRAIVLVVAGPSVMFENAMSSLIKKECSQFAFWLVAVAVLYWSLGLGLLVLELAMHLGR